jgi:hypothetical protein
VRGGNGSNGAGPHFEDEGQAGSPGFASNGHFDRREGFADGNGLGFDGRLEPHEFRFPGEPGYVASNEPDAPFGGSDEPADKPEWRPCPGGDECFCGTDDEEILGDALPPPDGQMPRDDGLPRDDRMPGDFPNLGDPPDLGDIVVVLLASSLAGLRDRLDQDGFHPAADLLADLVEAADDYLVGRTAHRPKNDDFK